LLWVELKLVAVLLSLKFTSKDGGGHNLGKITKRNESLTFQLDLKNCGRTLSTFHFYIGAMAFVAYH
jgi:hypothetical protein